MHLPSLFGCAVALLPLGNSLAIQHPESSAETASTYNAIIQAGYKTAYTLDTKNYEALGEVMTTDVVYDSTALGKYGGRSVGLDEVKTSVAAAFGDDLVEHIVTNIYIMELQTPTKARVITYITYSHWDPDALSDITKTYRIWYKCDDIWVVQNGDWKMQHSYVTNMGPGVEAPY
ncbi:hypothetical protein LTR56_016113 [Elasticomyces elasticus]|nr:hypothetical protein LTR56_016113 [Elasticomyces elasticus]KAK3636240.1 hypothetical protein LTR22_018845 [Elasticomyces elasticus]KAK4918332.1 hypothetical protein LTR49_013882 [Elasticomyces elasticus]KAK5762718.1 hypothetical protein LTS12_007107 [Elasticomyces elasticus]